MISEENGLNSPDDPVALSDPGEALPGSYWLKNWHAMAHETQLACFRQRITPMLLGFAAAWKTAQLWMSEHIREEA